MTAALTRARALLDQPPPPPAPGQLDLRSTHMDTDLIVEGFHGPGGWAEGRRILGLTTQAVGMEWDAAACATATAAGHTVVRCDVAEYPTSPCTCDDENTLVTVDMGTENGGVVDMCVSCYDAMRDEDSL